MSNEKSELLEALDSVEIWQIYAAIPWVTKDNGMGCVMVKVHYGQKSC
jgi:hypothetical protein